MNYKTIRYPGHCEKMQFLMHTLSLAKKPRLLQEVIECAIPQITQDVVLVYVSASGTKNGQFMERNFTQKYYPENISGINWSALQMCTASSICTVIDLLKTQKIPTHTHHVLQEQIPLELFLDNRFGQFFA